MTEHQSTDSQTRIRQRPEVTQNSNPQDYQSPQDPSSVATREVSWGYTWDETGQKFEIFGTRSGDFRRRQKIDHAVEITRPGKIEL